MFSVKSSSKRAFLLLSTVASHAEAKKIAEVLVRKKLCACVNIVPNVNSIFTWKNKVNRAKELLLVIKTVQGKLREVERTICEFHSYTVPEIIGWPMMWGHKPYLDWLFDSVEE